MTGHDAAAAMARPRSSSMLTMASPSAGSISKSVPLGSSVCLHRPVKIKMIAGKIREDAQIKLQRIHTPLANA